jgi:hypothetical protein
MTKEINACGAMDSRLPPTFHYGETSRGDEKGKRVKVNAQNIKLIYAKV